MSQTKDERRRQKKLVPLGHSVFGVFKKGKAVRIESRMMPTLRKMLTDDVLVGFVKAFNASERLNAFMHLVELNERATKMDGVAYSRNLRTIVFATYGLLYEAMDALRLLRAAGVEGVVGSDCLPWVRLEAMRVRWAKDKTLMRMRHGLANHLGNPDDILRGIKTTKPGRPIVLFETDGDGLRFDSASPFVLDILLRGMGLDGKSFKRFVNAAFVDHDAFGPDLERLLCTMLRLRGVNFGNDENIP